LGNYIDTANVEWTFRVGPSKNIVFCWVIFAKVYIAAEKRFKENEFVLARPDIAVIMAYYNPTPGKLNLNTKILLIKEFRTPATTPDGFIHELPGGSAKKDIPVLQIAHEELHEETGLDIDQSRFRVVQSRQLAGTLSAHKAHLYAVELTKAEISGLGQDSQAHGVTDDTERTYVEVRTLQDILSDGLLDWSMVGMVLSGLGI
jgi:8-oxo-dGTP pyrophosphatase MutT (NUDIX family)